MCVGVCVRKIISNIKFFSIKLTEKRKWQNSRTHCTQIKSINVNRKCSYFVLNGVKHPFSQYHLKGTFHQNGSMCCYFPIFALCCKLRADSDKQDLFYQKIVKTCSSVIVSLLVWFAEWQPGNFDGMSLLEFLKHQVVGTSLRFTVEQQCNTFVLWFALARGRLVTAGASGGKTVLLQPLVLHGIFCTAQKYIRIKRHNSLITLDWTTMHGTFLAAYL